PSARREAADRGVNIAAVTPTGPRGNVTKDDVSAAPRIPAVPPAPGPRPSAPPSASSAQRETREKRSTWSKRIAETLLQSQHNTAHLTTFNEVDMSAVMALRGRLKDRIEKEHGVKLTYMPFFAKAACMALDAYPRINAQVDGDTIVYRHYV